MQVNEHFFIESGIYTPFIRLFPVFHQSIFIRLPWENIDGKVYNPQLPSPNLDKYLICAQKNLYNSKKNSNFAPTFDM